MLRSFLPPSRWTGEEIFLDEGESKHLAAVMRAEPGMELELLDGEGRVARAAVADPHRKHTLVRLAEIRTIPPPPPRRVLVQALVREQKMDWLIQKAVELSASEIIPVQTERSVVRIAPSDAGKKARRWNEIAVAACKQSGNPWLPAIRPVVELRDLLESHPAFLSCAAFGALRPGAVPFPDWLRARRAAGTSSIAVFVGPEGDFSDAETAALRGLGVAPVTLGPIVFRVETASLFMLSSIQYEWLSPPLDSILAIPDPNR